jgi:predicted TPR repeat methyltransferase
LFLFSVEKNDDAHGWSLLPSRRHAHGKDYLHALLSANGFSVIDQREEVIRMDAGVPLTGLLWLALLDKPRP